MALTNATWLESMPRPEDIPACQALKARQKGLVPLPALDEFKALLGKRNELTARGCELDSQILGLNRALGRNEEPRADDWTAQAKRLAGISTPRGGVGEKENHVSLAKAREEREIVARAITLVNSEMTALQDRHTQAVYGDVRADYYGFLRATAQLAVLLGRLADAEHDFADALFQADVSCGALPRCVIRPTGRLSDEHSPLRRWLRELHRDGVLTGTEPWLKGVDLT